MVFWLYRREDNSFKKKWWTIYDTDSMVKRIWCIILFLLSSVQIWKQKLKHGWTDRKDFITEKLNITIWWVQRKDGTQTVPFLEINNTLYFGFYRSCQKKIISFCAPTWKFILGGFKEYTENINMLVPYLRQIILRNHE